MTTVSANRKLLPVDEAFSPCAKFARETWRRQSAFACLAWFAVSFNPRSRAGQVLFVAAKFVSTMKPKLILCLALVLSGGLLPVCAQNTNRCD